MNKFYFKQPDLLTVNEALIIAIQDHESKISSEFPYDHNAVFALSKLVDLKKRILGALDSKPKIEI